MTKKPRTENTEINPIRELRKKNFRNFRIKIQVAIKFWFERKIFDLTRWIFRKALKLHWIGCKSSFDGNDYYEHIQDEADKMLKKIYKKL